MKQEKCFSQISFYKSQIFIIELPCQNYNFAVSKICSDPYKLRSRKEENTNFKPYGEGNSYTIHIHIHIHIV